MKLADQKKCVNRSKRDRVEEAIKYWETKSLAEMTDAEWEGVCDGCAKCCLVKLQDDETEDVVYTNVACDLLDTQSCQCTAYAERERRVPTCVKLTPENLDLLFWMPPSCAYRLLHEGKPLPDWHPLVSGSTETRHAVGATVRGRVRLERTVTGALEDHVVEWPVKKI